MNRNEKEFLNSQSDNLEIFEQTEKFIKGDRGMFLLNKRDKIIGIVILIIVALVCWFIFTSAPAEARGGHGHGNSGHGFGNTGPGNQGNDGSNGNAGGNCGKPAPDPDPPAPDPPSPDPPGPTPDPDADSPDVGPGFDGAGLYNSIYSDFVPEEGWMNKDQKPCIDGLIGKCPKSVLVKVIPVKKPKAEKVDPFKPLTKKWVKEAEETKKAKEVNKDPYEWIYKPAWFRRIFGN